MQSMSVSLERACKRSAEDSPIGIYVSPNTLAKFRRRFPSEGGDTRKPLNNLKIIDTENNAEIPEQSLYLYVIPDETIGNAPQPLCQGLKSARSLDEADPCLGFVASPMAKDDASGNEMSSDERMVLESRLDHQQQENSRQQKRYDKLRAEMRTEIAAQLGAHLAAQRTQMETNFSVQLAAQRTQMETNFSVQLAAQLAAQRTQMETNFSVQLAAQLAAQREAMETAFAAQRAAERAEMRTEVAAQLAAQRTQMETDFSVQLAAHERR
ncbi:hypothetical protein CYMTET_19900 [Cymbomonas tetramitiformis]|uniref:Uncharacterized protein n=1 Tax=Cymbomonas tetramitiformis TaxID=36881 RepID=A0AAE0L4H8_9CHLO|nr:hypothetical protein CYMTET_19900 [Cymbomonas tetramitiformis]